MVCHMLRSDQFARGRKMAHFQNTFSPRELCSYLNQEIPTLSQYIIKNLEEHKVDGEVFLALNDKYLRQIAPLLGDRLKIK